MSRDRNGGTAWFAAPHFDLNSELHRSLSAAIPTLGRPVMTEYYADLRKSEWSTQLNSSSDSRLRVDLVEFPPVGRENLIRLGEDLLHVYPIYHEYQDATRQDEHVSSISVVISRYKTSPTSFTRKEETILAETFRKVPLPRQVPFQCLMPPVVRPYCLAWATLWAHGSDF